MFRLMLAVPVLAMLASPAAAQSISASDKAQGAKANPALLA